MAQKMLNKTWNLKMALCKVASRKCNQNPWRTPVNLWITLFFVKLWIPSLKPERKSTPSQLFFKDFDERFLEHYWWLLQKYLSLCKGEILHSEKSQRLWKGFKSLTIFGKKLHIRKLLTFFTLLKVTSATKLFFVIK